MDFHYRSHQIQEIVKAPKQIRSEKLAFQNYGMSGKRVEVDLELVGGPLVNCRLIVTAPRTAEPRTYTAALVLEGERIRGVDFSPVRKRRFFKETVSKGWHENVRDPNLPTADAGRNRHVGLRDFEVTDLQDFVQKVGKLWHIELGEEGVLL